MLPDILLDNENYDEIIERAKNMIVSMYPEWTDFNYHDPGVTMLELFSWLKESQQYYLNKIGPENRQKYLKLMGIFRRHKSPARTDVTLLYDEDILVTAGTRFYAGDLPFEAGKDTCIASARLICCAAERNGDISLTGRNELSFGGNLRIMPFRREDPSDGAFYLGFDKSLPAETDCEFFITVRDDGGVPRNPVNEGDGFIPLTDMEAEYFDGVLWQKAEIVRDTTYAFLLSGRITVRLPGKMESCSLRGEEACFLRFRITDGIYDTQPYIESIASGYVTLLQQDTKALCTDFPASASVTQTSELALTGKTRLFLRGEDGLFTEVSEYAKEIDDETGAVRYSGMDLSGCTGIRAVNFQNDFYTDGAFGTGSGLPYQEYDLDSADIDYDSFSLMTEMPGTGGRYAEWTRVRDFARSSPADLHYILDSEKGVLRFGDCIRGSAPEGKILITGYKLTAGAAGNIAKNKITRLSGFDADTLRVFNSRPASGGRDEETMSECLARAHALLQSTETMVSAADCEARIRSTPGLRIEKCQTVNMNTGVSPKKYADILTTVVVKPYAENGRGVPSGRYIENILKYTDRYRLLGTGLQIIAPDYADITVFADIHVSFGSTNARKLISDAVSAYFASVKDHFGAQISYSALYAALDRLECVRSINTLTVDASGSDVTRTREGDLILAPNVTAVLADADFIINTVY